MRMLPLLSPEAAKSELRSRVADDAAVTNEIEWIDDRLGCKRPLLEAPVSHRGRDARLDFLVTDAGQGGCGHRCAFDACRWSDRDLYLVVYGFDGKVWAHGFNEKMVGKVLIDLKDIDGKEFVRERTELAKTKSSFWMRSPPLWTG